VTFSPSARAWAAAVGGIVSVALGLAVGYLLAPIVDRGATPLQAVGSEVIDRMPKDLREWAIDAFGTSDKTVLLLVIAAIMTVLAAAAGLAELWRFPVGLVMVAAIGTLGALAAAARPTATPLWAVPTIVGVVLAMVVLHLLTRVIQPLDGRPPPVQNGDIGHRDNRTAPGTDRRRFVIGAATVGGGAVIAGLAGFAVRRTTGNVGADRATFVVPDATNPVSTQAPAVAEVSSFITPNDDFYRIDTALVVPQVKSGSWSLRIHGMVDRELRIDLDQLQREHTPFDAVVTLTCVSNEVGGDLVGNATWTGYRISELLAAAGPSADADMVLSTSADGWTAGTPLTALTDGRDAMLAVGMNGEPLPVEHGYPVRMVVPGLYGYVSATKWVVSMEVTKFDRAQAYWTTLGWAEKGPIKTSSRIDVPRAGSSLTTGPITVGGVAWAQGRGISAVQVQVDKGPWHDAELIEPDVIDAWRLWKWVWDATSGEHELRVRAVDGEGRPQTTVEAQPVPDGASGLHSIQVQVRA
jgi:sulfite oxidase